MRHVILAIGETGLGKSYTGNVFGGNFRVGDTTESETRVIEVQECGDQYIYIDTPGFNDSKDMSDRKVAIEIIKGMLDRGITSVTTILWFIQPGVRASASLKRTAVFIKALAVFHEGNVWDNVIIVVRGGHTAEAGDGPVDAIREVETNNKRITPQVFKVCLFETLSPDDPLRDFYQQGQLSEERLNKTGIFFRDKFLSLRKAYETIMVRARHKDHPINNLVRQDAKCRKCNETADPRLAGSNCHVSEVKTHVYPSEEYHRFGNLRWSHSDDTTMCHKSDAVLRRIHPTTIMRHKGSHVKDTPTGLVILKFATLPIPGVNLATSAIAEANTDIKWSCCDRLIEDPGCTHACCGRDEPCEQVYSCCNSLASCTLFCKNCDRPLSEKGCRAFHACCGRTQADAGCAKRCPRCKIDSVQPTNGAIQNGGGCTSICRNCNQAWGTTPGCYPRPHEYSDSNIANRLEEFQRRLPHE